MEDILHTLLNCYNLISHYFFNSIFFMQSPQPFYNCFFTQVLPVSSLKLGSNVFFKYIFFSCSLIYQQQSHIIIYYYLLLFIFIIKAKMFIFLIFLVLILRSQISFFILFDADFVRYSMKHSFDDGYEEIEQKLINIYQVLGRLALRKSCWNFQNEGEMLMGEIGKELMHGLTYLCFLLLMEYFAKCQDASGSDNGLGLYCSIFSFYQYYLQIQNIKYIQQLYILLFDNSNAQIKQFCLIIFSKYRKEKYLLFFDSSDKFLYVQKYTFNMSTQNSKTTILLKSGIAGSIRALMSLPFEHPFDALKTNMQANQQKMKVSIQQMLKRKGWRAFYNGFSMNLIRVMIKQFYRWPLWIGVQSFYKKLLPNTNEILRQTITGFSISFCQLIIVCPFERIKVWLMTTKTQDQTKFKHFFKQIISIKDLYTGFVSLLIRQGLSWSSFLASTQIMKSAIKSYKKTDTLTSTQLFLGSIPVSIVNTLFIMPVDCIKTFYQQYGEPNRGQSFITTVKRMVNTYGIRGLYLGWTSRMVQYNIQTSFTLILVQDYIKQFEAIGKVKKNSVAKQ